MHIKKKSLVNKKVAAATIIPINSGHSRRVDLSKPALSRVLTLTTLHVGAMVSSGKHIKIVVVEGMRASGDSTPPPPPPPPPS